MSGAAGQGRAWRIGAALALAGLIAAAPLPAQGRREMVTVGEVTAVADPADLDLAVALAERADQASTWYGLGRRAAGPLAIVVVRGQRGFDAIARGRLPSWGAGLAVPRARVIAIRADAGDPFQILRHELAHVVLHGAVRGRVPLWFDEGYAAVAAGEFGRLAALELSLGVALGKVPGFTALNAQLRASSAEASTAYGLAATAVLYVARRHPTGSAEPFLERLAAGVPFDSALVLSTGLTVDRLEEAWQLDVKRRHGIGLWFLGTGIWIALGGLVVVATWLRRRRDAPRRAALDQGWVVELPVEAVGVQDGTSEPEPLDRST
ncbi:MAG: peptidase MA family metallohydrolase [Gemmatimonadales bacterium]